jgi:hypothetical protein
MIRAAKSGSALKMLKISHFLPNPPIAYHTSIYLYVAMATLLKFIFRAFGAAASMTVTEFVSSAVPPLASLASLSCFALRLKPRKTGNTFEIYFSSFWDCANMTGTEFVSSAVPPLASLSCFALRLKPRKTGNTFGIYFSGFLGFFSEGFV